MPIYASGAMFESIMIVNITAGIFVRGSLVPLQAIPSRCHAAPAAGALCVLHESYAARAAFGGFATPRFSGWAQHVGAPEASSFPMISIRAIFNVLGSRVWLLWFLGSVHFWRGAAKSRVFCQHTKGCDAMYRGVPTSAGLKSRFSLRPAGPNAACLRMVFRRRGSALSACAAGGSARLPETGELCLMRSSGVMLPVRDPQSFLRLEGFSIAFGPVCSHN